MSGSNNPLVRVRSAAMVAAVAALLASVGTSAARAETPRAAIDDVVPVSAVAFDGGPLSVRNWAVVPR